MKLRSASKPAASPGGTVWDGGLGGPIFSSWDIRSWPTTYVIDRQGIIRHKNVFGKELDQAVDALLSD